MRTAAICPTCATYENALCTLYNGPYLSCIGVSPLDSLEAALGHINGAVCLNNSQIVILQNDIADINDTIANLDLQTITSVGNTTNTGINLTATPPTAPTGVTIGGINNMFSIAGQTHFVVFNINGLTANQGIIIPNNSGTMALLSDIPSTPSLQDVMNVSYVTTAGLTFTTALSNNIATIDSLLLTSDRTYQLPDAAGTIALTNTVWALTGNAGTTAGTNFIGTTDAIDFVTKTNSVERMRVGSTGNVGIGRTASTFLLEVNRDASFNDVRVGKGNNNIATNTTLGYQSSNAITTGNQNTAIGYQVLKSTTNGSNNVGIGHVSLTNNTFGAGNTAIGMQSLATNVGGNANTAVGIGALATSANGDNNTAIGAYALVSAAAGAASENTAIGRNAGANITNGLRNTFIGAYTANTLTNGDDNTVIGQNVDVPSNTTSGYVLIGDGQGNVRFKDDGTDTIIPRLAGIGSRVVKVGTNGEFSAVSGFTGSKTIGGQVYTWTDGILVSVV